MKKISLQWRLTLLTCILVTCACLILNLFITRSGVMQIDGMENYILEVEPEEDSLIVGVDAFAIYPDLPAQIQQSKELFRLQSILATLAVIVISCCFTYFLSGRALRPLRELSDHMEKIQAQNLSEPLAVSDSRDEIGKLERSFNGMLKRLEQTFAVQRQFSANAAHELRTPLAVMQTKLDVLQKRTDITPPEYEEMIRMMSEQTGRLSNLVDVLLEMTELQTVKLDGRIHLCGLLEEVLCDLEQVAQKKDVTLVQESGQAVVSGNDTLLYRAVYNLVENAIKYNRDGGTVRAGIRTEKGTAVLYVKDTGIGITKDNWEKIFDPFVRVDKSRSRAMGGAGLGLALVRDIAQRHHGQAEIVSSSEQGTEIVLRLPQAE